MRVVSCVCPCVCVCVDVEGGLWKVCVSVFFCSRKFALSLRPSTTVIIWDRIGFLYYCMLTVLGLVGCVWDGRKGLGPVGKEGRDVVADDPRLHQTVAVDDGDGCYCVSQFYLLYYLYLPRLVRSTVLHWLALVWWWCDGVVSSSHNTFQEHRSHPLLFFLLVCFVFFLPESVLRQCGVFRDIPAERDDDLIVSDR